MIRLALLALCAVVLVGCVSSKNRTDLTPTQQKELQASINLMVACDSITNVISSLKIQKKAGKISVANDQKILKVLDVTDPVCKPGAVPATNLQTMLPLVRAGLVSLQRIEKGKP